MKSSLFIALALTLALVNCGRPASQETVTAKVGLVLQVGEYKYLDPIVIGLFGYTAPKTVDNFLKICTRKNLVVNGTKMSFDNSKFHRIIPGFMMQGGDFTAGDGTGGMSIFGNKFNDENFTVDFAPGVVAMANSGPNTNGSQFFITFAQTSWLNGKHTVFGRVLSGQKLVSFVETKGGNSGEPTEPVVLVSCYQIVDNDEDAAKCTKEL